MATEVATAEIPAEWKANGHGGTYFTPKEVTRTARWAAKCDGLRFVSWELRVTSNGVSLVILGTRTSDDGRTVYAVTTCAI